MSNNDKRKNSQRRNPDGWPAFADRAIRELVPKVTNSAYCMNLFPSGGTEMGRNDIKYCVELGMMILMDKPIILIVPPGMNVPDKVVRVADAIIEMSMDDERFKQRLADTIDEMDKKYPDARKKQDSDNG